MHTSGTVGADHDTIMVLLSLHPEGTPYQDCAQQVTAIARALYLTVKASPADPADGWPDVESPVEGTNLALSSGGASDPRSIECRQFWYPWNVVRRDCML